jgi:molecular chaperone GrpE
MPEKKSAKIEIVSDETTDPDGKANGSDDAGPSAGQEDALAALQRQLQDTETELKETHDRLLRVSAEFDNYKKRSARETSEFRKYANQALLKDLLPVVDNLDLAINSTGGQSEIDKSLVEGLAITRKEIMKVLEKFHVTAIEAIGKPFDPEFHEAVMRQESGEHAENTVISEFQKGYLIHDRLLRPAMVVVASPKASES